MFSFCQFSSGPAPDSCQMYLSKLKCFTRPELLLKKKTFLPSGGNYDPNTAQNRLLLFHPWLAPVTSLQPISVSGKKSPESLTLDIHQPLLGASRACKVRRRSVVCRSVQRESYQIPRWPGLSRQRESPQRCFRVSETVKPVKGAPQIFGS